MAKKRPAKKNSGFGNPAKNAQRGRSMHRLQIAQAVEAISADYTEWVSGQVPTFTAEQAAQAARMHLDVIRDSAGDYAELARSSELFDLDPELFGNALAEFLVDLPESLAPEPILTSWLDFFSFAEDRGLWEGEEETLEELREMLEDVLGGFAEGDAELCELLRATKLFTMVKGFAEAIGENGIDLSEQGEGSDAARAKVFAAVGIDPQSVNPEDPAPLIFTYVWNAALLSVIDAEDGKVTTNQEAFEQLLQGDQTDSAQLLFEMAVGAVQAHLHPTGEDTLRDEAHYLVLRNLLVTASTGREGDTEGLRRNVGPKIYDAVLPEAQAAMASLVELGLLESEDGVYRIDERLVPVISAGISEVEAYFEDVE